MLINHVNKHVDEVAYMAWGRVLEAHEARYRARRMAMEMKLGITNMSKEDAQEID